MKKGANSRQPYSDEDLIAILSDVPTRANAVKHAARFNRSTKAIEMIYKCAMNRKEAIEKLGREDNALMIQVRRVAKQRLGWLDPIK